jgi:hypothetical protein
MLLLMLFTQGQAMQQLTGIEATKLEGLGTNTGGFQAGSQAKAVEHLDSVGAHLDARANLAQLRRLLENAHVVAPLEQRCCSRQPADAGTDNNNIHETALFCNDAL